MVPKCGVCRELESKYKCPVCELRYCSIACYKIHKSTHEQHVESAESESPSQPLKDRPGTTQRVPKVGFTGFRDDEDLAKLLNRYPLLKTQLQAVYGLTLEPGPDEARGWNRQPLPGFDRYSVAGQRGSSRGRSRGSFTRGRGRGRSTGSENLSNEREYGAWTQAKGDKEALRVIKKMREEGNDHIDLRDGMAEFIELCQIKFGEQADIDRQGG